jgi:cupin fold WbuC family metalloprotein
MSAAISSRISLDDQECVLLDTSGRSPAYFCHRKPVRITQALIDDLVVVGKSSGHGVRLCLHKDASAFLHNMIVVQASGVYFRPHKHLEKAETYHMIRGEMGMVTFDENGEITEASRLDAQDNLIYGVGPGMYHVNFPLSDVVVYHESRPGPFSGGDSISPDWAPDENDQKTIKQFLGRLTRAVEN